MLQDNIKNLPHTGRTLEQHLEGTANILKHWLCSHDVVNVGKYHSVYGTTVYKNQATNNRQEIVELVGAYAEKLIYEFCTTPSPRMQHFVYNNNKELILVECANLMEQKSKNFNALKLARDHVPMYIAEDIDFYIMDHH